MCVCDGKELLELFLKECGAKRGANYAKVEVICAMFILHGLPTLKPARGCYHALELARGLLAHFKTSQ